MGAVPLRKQSTLRKRSVLNYFFVTKVHRPASPESASYGCANLKCKGHQPDVAAPSFRMTSLQTFFKPKAQALATRCACRGEQTDRTLRLYAILPKTGRLATASFKSIARNLRRGKDQNFSAGFRSGERGGTCHKGTPASRPAC